MDPTHRRSGIAAYVFAFCFFASFFSYLGGATLPYTSGDTLYDGNVESGVPVPFSVAEGAKVHFRLDVHYWYDAKDGQQARFIVHDAGGAELSNASANFTILKSGETGRVKLRVPVFTAPAAGDYTATWLHVGGAPATETKLAVIDGGYHLRDGRPSIVFFGCLVTFIIGFVALMFVRAGRDDATGRDRFWPIHGASNVGLVVAIALGLATAFMILYRAAGNPFG